MTDIYRLWPARAAICDPNTGLATPEFIRALGRIAMLFGGESQTLPVSFTYVPVSGTPFGMAYLDSNGGLTSTTAPTDGQILIGDTGGVPVLGSLTGTVNRITVTVGAGTITLSTPQDIAAASTPTFAGLTLTGLTANAFTYSGTGGAITSTAAPTDGQLLIGDTGGPPVLAALTGTANQVVVTNGPGSITLSLPQSIGTSSTPNFADLVGTITNDSAAAGNIGEFVTSLVASGSAVSLTTAVTANVTSISLTAGDWDVTAWAGFIPAATTSASAYAAEISTTSAAYTADLEQAVLAIPATVLNIRQQLTVPSKRISIAATTTVYLVASSVFTISTMGAFGRISARRVR